MNKSWRILRIRRTSRSSSSWQRLKTSSCTIWRIAPVTLHMKAGSGQFIPLSQGVDGHTEQLNKSRDWHTLRVSARWLSSLSTATVAVFVIFPRKIPLPPYCAVTLTYTHSLFYSHTLWSDARCSDPAFTWTVRIRCVTTQISITFPSKSSREYEEVSLNILTCSDAFIINCMLELKAKLN